MRISDYTGKNVFIVGGSSGIGLATAKLLTRRGAHVTIFARRLDVLQTAAAELTELRISTEQRVEYAQLDAGDAQHVNDVMTAAVEELSTPDVLINLAGRARPDYFEAITPEQLTETLRLNVATCWNTVSALVPYMSAHGGYIVNTSSLAGIIGVFGYTDYCAAKFAVIGFSEALRSELRRHRITVSVLCPPDTDTPALQQEDETKPAETRAISAAARVMSADQVAAALVRGIAKGKFLIVPGTMSKLAVMAKRFAPGFVERMNERAIRKLS